MNDCGCDKARKELEEYLHNELCSEDAADIRAHIETCVTCTDEHQVGVVLTEVVSRACAEDAVAPAELRTQVLTRLRVIQAAHPEQPVGCACGHVNGRCTCGDACGG
ncbi:MAG: zf-HC2 domain-containing protein [Microbacteriaceae bacterium]